MGGLRVFLAGATGVIGIRLLPLLLAEGHVIAGMTRTPGKIEALRAVGVTPVLCDLFDPGALNRSSQGREEHSRSLTRRLRHD